MRELRIVLHKGTLYVLGERPLIGASVVEVEGFAKSALLYVGGGYVPAVEVEDWSRADVVFVEGETVFLYARLYWVWVDDEVYGSYESMCAFADVGVTDRCRLVEPGSLGSAYGWLRWFDGLRRDGVANVRRLDEEGRRW